MCLADSGISDGVAIIDKGFQSASNIAQLDELGIKFTMSLKRSTKGLDYTILPHGPTTALKELFYIIKGLYGGNASR